MTITIHPLTALLGRLSRHAALLLLLLVPISAFAAGAAPGAGQVNGMVPVAVPGYAGHDNLTAVRRGPLLWILMGAAVIVAIYGFANDHVDMALAGLGAFILAAVLKGLFALMKT